MLFSTYVNAVQKSRELERLNNKLKETVSKLERAHDEIKQKADLLEKQLEKVLRGLLLICCSCKKIRNEDGLWQVVEEYIENHSDVKFSHGICPECVNKLYPEIMQE